ncbi:MAG: M20 family metallopeptidase [Hyphomicrobiaceae bacterium]
MTAHAIQLTRTLVQIPTINPPGNELAAAQHLGAVLEDAGFSTELVAMGEGRANLVARIGGVSDTPPLAFTGHIDVVPLGAAAWSMDPFGAETADGKLYGRGSSDMKSGVAAFVAAAVELAPRLAHSPGLLLVITAGEETGCEGAFHLARTRPELLDRAGALIVAEPSSNRPLVGHKGALWLKALSLGVTAHGSMPDKGDNAVYKAARAVGRLESFDFNVARHPVMGPPTLNVGWLHGGMNINSVPDRAEIGIDIRTIPGLAHDRLVEALASLLQDEASIDRLLDVEGIWTTPDHPWVEEVFAAVKDITGQPAEVAAASYFTDASALAPALGGPPTIVLGPGPAHMAHQTDEYCELDRIDEARAIFSRLIAGWCGL